MTPQELCANAADYIEEHGWIRGSFDEWDGSVCVVGAINVVATGDPRGTSMGLGFDTWKLVKTTVGISGSLSAWNDEQTSAAPVIAALRKAAES